MFSEVFHRGAVLKNFINLKETTDDGAFFDKVAGPGQQFSEMLFIPHGDCFCVQMNLHNNAFLRISPQLKTLQIGIGLNIVEPLPSQPVLQVDFSRKKGRDKKTMDVKGSVYLIQKTFINQIFYAHSFSMKADC